MWCWLHRQHSSKTYSQYQPSILARLAESCIAAHCYSVKCAIARLLHLSQGSKAVEGRKANAFSDRRSYRNRASGLTASGDAELAAAWDARHAMSVEQVFSGEGFGAEQSPSKALSRECHGVLNRHRCAHGAFGVICGGSE